MRGFLAAVLGLSLALQACDAQPSAMSDDEIAFLRETYPMMKDACIDQARREGLAMLNVSVDVCFPMEETRRWSGLWVNEFEGSRFCPKPATKCDYSGDNRDTWLSFADGEKPSGLDTYDDGRVYSVEFLGRRTLLSSYHGHEGAFAHEIIIDELLKIEPVEQR